MMNVLVIMLFACKSDIKTFSHISANDSVPELTAKNMEFIRSDSGIVKAKLTSALMHQYDGENPYIVFPEGFKVVFYEGKNTESILTADYGISYTRKKLLKASKNVLFLNILKQEQLNTEELIWDQRKKIIYSDVDVKITTQDEILFGNGLKSDEKFNHYEIINPHGQMTVKEDENN